MIIRKNIINFKSQSSSKINLLQNIEESMSQDIEILQENIKIVNNINKMIHDLNDKLSWIKDCLVTKISFLDNLFNLNKEDIDDEILSFIKFEIGIIHREISDYLKLADSYSKTIDTLFCNSMQKSSLARTMLARSEKRFAFLPSKFSITGNTEDVENIVMLIGGVKNSYNAITSHSKSLINNAKSSLVLTRISQNIVLEIQEISNTIHTKLNQFAYILID